MWGSKQKNQVCVSEAVGSNGWVGEHDAVAKLPSWQDSRRDILCRNLDKRVLEAADLRRFLFVVQHSHLYYTLYSLVIYPAEQKHPYHFTSH